MKLLDVFLNNFNSKSMNILLKRYNKKQLHKFKYINFLLLFFSLFQSIGNTSLFAKQDLYTALTEQSLELVNKQLRLVTQLEKSDKIAFEGVLFMKKASMVVTPKEKLLLFKKGKQKLELAIKQDLKNVEYKFLRLIIQENAPPFLGYHSNIKNDSNEIQQNLEKLPLELQAIIKDYSLTSKALKI